MKYDFLTEGLFANDLVGLVLPTISINEFEPKIEKTALVIAFFVKNKEAAEDLSVFLEKSAIEDILDAEVSAAPDEGGYYLVFIEVSNKIAVEMIMKIIAIANHLCSIDEWIFQGYKLSKKYSANKANIKTYLQAIKEGKI